MKTSRIEMHTNEKGELLSIEANKHVPFEIKRTYFILNNHKKLDRGFHAHKNLNQAAICLTGSCSIFFDDLKEKKTVKLSSPDKLVLIPPMVWHEVREFSSDCILVVFADDFYNEEDYIRDFSAFKNFINN